MFRQKPIGRKLALFSALPLLVIFWPIYKDGGIAAVLKASTDLNLDDLSHQRIIESLEGICD